MVPARTWGVHAVGMSPTERLNMRRQMAVTAGKKSTTSLSLFMEAFGLEVEEDVYSGHPVLGRRVWIGKWPDEQKEDWKNQAPEVQTWRQVRGPAGAVMCETRRFGHQDTLEDAQKARSVYWKKWAAKHEYEELKEGTWLEPALAMLRKKM